VATPAPGSRITPNTRITLTFSRPVSRVLGAHLPPVSPRTAGNWRRLNSHSIQFVPQGYGYGLGADVKVSLPSGVNLVGGQARGSDPVGQWLVPDGSTLALQQLLAQLGYLPVTFTPSSGSSDIAQTPAAEEAAIVNPPQGTFAWRYPDTPALLKSLWSPNSYSELTKGAVMAFEQDQGLPTDGVPGPDVWKALINAAVNGKKSTFGYTFVMVSEISPETIRVWHNGRIVVHGLANTGIAAAPTATGTYAVFEHIPVGTMSGKNPDGTTYHDPGIPYISYFNGGDALHGFIRASYGFPQSLGCVEMPYSEAGAVYPYTPIGTIVNVAS
jgi:peptidoglycan hydrolase-like protein with peptidoglycan-binding domain